MISMPFEQILEKLSTQSNTPKEILTTRIEEKMEQLNGLVSREGAAHIVANELGVKLIQQATGAMKITAILPGMRNVETVGKVTAVYDVREFQKENMTGKVGSCVIADETGSMRVTCWHDQTDNLVNVKIDDIVRLVDVHARDNRGQSELHLNEKSRFIINPPNVTIDVIQTSSAKTERKYIKELEEFQNNVEIFGTIVQVFEPRYFEVCPECNKRSRPTDGGYSCDTHTVTTPNYSYVMNVVLDDGTDTMRIVCFREQANAITSMTHEEFLQCKDDTSKFDSVKNTLLGMQIIIGGRVKKNAMFDRLEFLSQNINLKPNVEEEIKRVDAQLAVSQ